MYRALEKPALMKLESRRLVVQFSYRDLTIKNESIQKSLHKSIIFERMEKTRMPC